MMLNHKIHYRVKKRQAHHNSLPVINVKVIRDSSDCGGDTVVNKYLELRKAIVSCITNCKILQKNK